VIQRTKDVIRFIGRSSKRVAVAVVGGALVVAGLAMLVLPGPGLVLIVIGFAVRGTEFVWAERALDYTKQKATTAGNAVKRTVRRR
jgi:uncharacterized protein (TIGR02611 family)